MRGVIGLVLLLPLMLSGLVMLAAFTVASVGALILCAPVEHLRDCFSNRNPSHDRNMADQRSSDKWK